MGGSSNKTYPVVAVKKDPTNPEYIGPGFWINIHSMARRSGEIGTMEMKMQFIDYMRSLTSSFPCGVCRNHIKEYLDNHPFNSYMTIKYNGVDVGLFKWSVDFHNTVNNRLGKEVLSFETAHDMYYSADAVCSADCGY